MSAAAAGVLALVILVGLCWIAWRRDPEPPETDSDWIDRQW